MTLEEKRLKIIGHCKKMCDEWRCTSCALHNLDGVCYEDDDFIDRNYAVLFGDSNGDPVNKASHYNDGGIECIEAIAASMTPSEYAGFLKGQVLKYIWRYLLKGRPVEDLKKARYYLDRLIRLTEKEASDK